MSPRRVELLLATACGLVIANLYYGQPLLDPIGTAIGLSVERRGLIVTLPLAGYGVGLLTIVPLGDLFGNRRLVLLLVAVEAAAVAVVGFASSTAAFLALAFVAGIAAASVQLMVPYGTYMVAPAERGRVVGKVVSGVMLGIMLARPVSSLLASDLTWRSPYLASALEMVVLLAILYRYLPERRPDRSSLGYLELLASLARLYLAVAVVRRRGFYHACMFGAFSVFWTALPLWLASERFGLSQRGIALVALAGVAGAVAAPIAGRLADRGYGDRGTALAMLLAISGFGIAGVARGGTPGALGLVVFAAIAIDFAVSAHLIFSQREIYALSEAERSRLNGLFMATFFVGGAICAALGNWTYARFGWAGVASLGAALPCLGLLSWATDYARRPSPLRSEQ